MRIQPNSSGYALCNAIKSNAIRRHFNDTFRNLSTTLAMALYMASGTMMGDYSQKQNRVLSKIIFEVVVIVVIAKRIAVISVIVLPIIRVVIENLLINPRCKQPIP